MGWFDVKFDEDLYHRQQVEIHPRRIFLHAGGTENERLFSDMEALCGKKPVSSCSARLDVKRGDCQDKLRAFADSLNKE
jgi:hypothetical protein